MKNNLKLSFFLKVKDCFHYMNNLFVIDEDCNLKCINLDQLYYKYLAQWDNLYTRPLYSIFIDNKSFNRYSYQNNQDYKNFFNDKWDEFSSPDSLQIEVNEDDWQILLKVPDPHVLDFIIYAKKALIACRSGIYEANLEFGETVKAIRKFDKIHDVKAHMLSTKIGELLVMSNFDGVFQGSLWQNYETLKITDKPIIEKSRRVGWMNTDLLNYQDYSSYVYYHNDVEEVKDQHLEQAVNFKVDDGNTKSLRVKEYGSVTYDLTDKITDSNLLYAYNSNNYLFLLQSQGYIHALKIEPDGRIARYFEFKHSATNIDIEKLGKTLSAHMVGYKTVVFEFFDTILSLKNKTYNVISKTEASKIKSYINSKNYQHLVSIVDKNKMELHSFFPMPL